MGTVTSFLSLLKPDPGEKVNVLTHINQNFDKIAAGILAQKTRIDVIETGWTNYVPEIKYGGVVTAHDINLARWRNLGGLVTVQIEATTTASAEAITAAPKIKVPLLVNSHVVNGAGTWMINISGGPGVNFRPIMFAPLTDNVGNRSYMHIAFSSANIALSSTGVGSSEGIASTKARLSVQFTYLTDGTATP